MRTPPLGVFGGLSGERQGAQESHGVAIGGALYARSVVPDPFADLASRFVDHYKTLRGIVRAELVHRQLEEHLPNGSLLVADVGGGDGRQSVRLASLGHTVDLIDPSQEMLERAQKAIAQQPETVRSRIRLIDASAEDATETLGTDRYDVVLCHGVIMYFQDPAPLVGILVSLARPGEGLISLVAKNAEALALRPALQGRWEDALKVLDLDRDVGGLGVVTRGDPVESLTRLFSEAGASLVDWYGVRVLTDHLTDLPPPPNTTNVVELEWRVGSRDPYRRVGHLIHLIARR